MNQVEHLLKLADEYQAGGIVDVCVKVLATEPTYEHNAVKILHLATSTATVREDERLVLVRVLCYEVIKNMELTETQGKESYKNLEKEALERVLVKRIQRLETFVREIYPQFVDLVEFSLRESLRENTIFSCPQHFSDRKAKKHLLRRMKVCPLCRLMIKKLIVNLKKSQQPPQAFGFSVSQGFSINPTISNKPEYIDDCHLDEKVISIILDFEKIIRV